MVIMLFIGILGVIIFSPFWLPYWLARTGWERITSLRGGRE
jgi:hypothetical protein